MAHDPVLARIAKIKWNFAEYDLGAIRTLEQRLAAAARDPSRTPITYSDLCRGVVLHLPNVGGGEPFQLGLPDWTELHRAILGDLLGYISCRSYERGGGHYGRRRSTASTPNPRHKRSSVSSVRFTSPSSTFW